jgi:Protein of unknown function (DUF1573)
MNKRLTNGFITVLAGLFMLSLLAAAAGAGTPKIKFKETAWDFGKIKQGEVASHEFVFVNEGDDTLTIEKVSTSCGCTAALVSDRSIPPGKSGKIEVKFDSRGYGGQVAKVVYVLSNDPKAAQLPLEIKAEIEVPPSAKIEIDPYNYDSGLMVEGDEILANLKIMNRGEHELRVEFNHRSAAYSIGGKPAPVPLKIAAGKEAAVLIRIPTQNRTGAVREYVLIKSNDPMRSTLSLYISGYIITKEQLKDLFGKYKDILR